MDLISVIIPTYKRAETLYKTIESVYKQTYTNLEIIVVIDGYDKDVERKIKKRKYPDLKILSYARNRGANYARNYGAKHANGQYLAFLDDDDTWEKTKLEKQYNVLKLDEGTGLVYTGRKIHYPEYKIKYYVQPNCKGNLARNIIQSNCIGSTSTPLIRKKIFQKVGGFDEQFPARQDYDLWIRICQETNVDYIDEPLVNYYNYNNTTQISDNTTKAKEATELIQKKYVFLLQQLTKKEREEWEVNNLKNFAKRYQRAGNPKRARNLYIKIFKKQKNITNLLFILTTFLSYKSLLQFKSIIQ